MLGPSAQHVGTTWTELGASWQRGATVRKFRTLFRGNLIFDRLNDTRCTVNSLH